MGLGKLHVTLLKPFVEQPIKGTTNPNGKTNAQKIIVPSQIGWNTWSNKAMMPPSKDAKGNVATIASLNKVWIICIILSLVATIGVLDFFLKLVVFIVYPRDKFHRGDKM